MKNSEKPKKPIDRWLGLIGIAAGIFYWLIPKSPLTIIISLFVIFALLIHPVWNCWWIEEYRRRQLTSILVLTLILFLFGYMSWPRLEKTKEVPVPTIQLNLPSVIMTQQMPSDINLLEIDPDVENDQLTAVLRNSYPMSISADANVWLGTFRFGEKPSDNSIKWIKSKDKKIIPTGGIQSFRFDVPTEHNMWVVIALESKEFQDGIILDEMGLLYTWDHWKYLSWTTWQDHRGNVAESGKIQMLLNKFKDCRDGHSVDKKYSACFD